MLAAARPSFPLVSPMQAALGAFFGGIIGFGFFCRANFIAVGDRAGASRMLTLSIALFVAWHAAVALALFNAASVPLTMLFGVTPFVLLGAAHGVAQKQMASANDHAVVRSGWSVFAITALCFVASAACALAVIVGVVVALLATSGFRG